MVYGDRFGEWFSYGFIIDFEQNWLPKFGAGEDTFHHFFDTVPQVVFLKVPWLALAPFWLPFS